MKSLLLFFLLPFVAFANIGNIMALTGKVQLHKLTGNIISAKSGMEIQLGDKITTTKLSRVQVMLKDDTLITIGANSSFQFDKYFFDGSKKSTAKMKLNRGFFRSVTGKIGKLAPERFTVETSSATIGIRGTDFSATVRNAIERFKCYRGKIIITIDDLVKELSAGEFFEFNPDNIHIAPQIKNQIKEQRFTPSTEELSDITEVDQSDHIKIPEQPEPIIPDGVPCQPCAPKTY